MGLLCIALSDRPIFQVQHTVLLFCSRQFFLCRAGAKTRCIYISRLLCLFSKHFLSFFAWQKMLSVLRNYTMTTWQGLIFWNNSCTSLSNVCRSQHLEAASNTTCANSNGQRTWSKLPPNNVFTGATVSLEVIWRTVLGEKTSPSAEYYARHVLGQWVPCSVSLITTSQKHIISILQITQFDCFRKYGQLLGKLWLSQV